MSVYWLHARTEPDNSMSPYGGSIETTAPCVFESIMDTSTEKIKDFVLSYRLQ